MTVRDTNAC